MNIRMIAAAVAVVALVGGMPAEAKDRRAPVQSESTSFWDGLDGITKFVDPFADGVKGKGSKSLGYISGGIGLAAAIGRVASAEAAYNAAPKHLRAEKAGELKEAQNDLGRTVISNIPVGGSMFDIVEGLGEGDIKKVLCGAVSLGGTFATGGASEVLRYAGMSCSIFSLVAYLDQSTGKVVVTSGKWSRDIFDPVNSRS